MDERNKIRARVLRAFYDANENAPGTVQDTATIAVMTKRAKKEVDRETQYLSGVGLINITRNHGPLDNDMRLIAAIITSRGVDVIEDPNKSGSQYLEAETVQQITIVNNTHVSGGNLVQGHQQVVHGNNSGVMLNASSAGNINLPTFPIEQLRRMLPDGTPERRAAEELVADSTSPSRNSQT